MFVVDPHAEVLAPQFTSKLRAPYSVLATLLGPPFKDRPEKCSTYWALRSEADDEAFACIKDFADTPIDTKAFRAEPVHDWDVQATTQGVGMTFCRWLSGQVIAKLSEVKTLSADAKATLNKLIAEGVPMGEAMKQVTLEKPTDLAKRYAWPIKK